MLPSKALQEHELLTYTSQLTKLSQSHLDSLLPAADVAAGVPQLAGNEYSLLRFFLRFPVLHWHTVSPARISSTGSRIFSFYTNTRDGSLPGTAAHKETVILILTRPASDSHNESTCKYARGCVIFFTHSALTLSLGFFGDPVIARSIYLLLPLCSATLRCWPLHEIAVLPLSVVHEDVSDRLTHSYLRLHFFAHSLATGAFAISSFSVCASHISNYTAPHDPLFATRHYGSINAGRHYRIRCRRYSGQ